MMTAEAYESSICLKLTCTSIHSIGSHFLDLFPDFTGIALGVLLQMSLSKIPGVLFRISNYIVSLEHRHTVSYNL